MNPDPVPDREVDTDDALWLQLQHRVAEHLTTMADPDDAAMLRIELLVGEDEGCGPYVQVCTAESGRALLAEISANRFLQPQYHLDAREAEQLQLLGWRLAEQGNWERLLPIEDGSEVAEMAVWTLRHLFGVPHPQLLSYVACIGGEDQVVDLGLAASADVTSETSGGSVAGIGAAPEPDAIAPADREELVALVRQTLAAAMGHQPEVDGDGDFVVDHHGHPFYVRVLPDQPGVMIFALVVQGVRSRQGTAGQLAVLNAKMWWTTLQLASRDVWLRVLLPAQPFAPDHLRSMMGVAQQAYDEVRDDLALQSGGRAA